MKNYTFTRDLNLGIVQLSVKKGDIVTQKNGVFIYNNQKYNNVRDFQIALQKGWLVDSETFVQAENIVNKAQQIKTNNFGFSVKKEQENGVSISLNQFKSTIIDEQNGFVQQNGEIKSIEQSEVHVAPIKANVEQPKNANQGKQSDVKPTSDKEVTKKKTTPTKASKTNKKPQAKKNSKIIQGAQLIEQKVVGQVMGMKIIKGQ